MLCIIINITSIIAKRKIYFKKSCILKTEISDFHKLTAVSLKSQILRAPPKQRLSKNNQSFDENSFINDLKPKLDSIKNLDYSLFEDISINVLNTDAPIKNKILRANSHESIQALRKGRSKLKNVYLKNQITNNLNKYKYQLNFWIYLLRKRKFHYFRNLNVNDLNDNSKF